VKRKTGKAKPGRASTRKLPPRQQEPEATDDVPEVISQLRDAAVKMIAARYNEAGKLPLDTRKIPQLHIYPDALIGYLNEAERLLMQGQPTELAVTLARTVRAVKFLSSHIDQPNAKVPKLNALARTLLDEIDRGTTKFKAGPMPFPDGLDVAYDDRRSDGIRMMLQDANELHEAGQPHRQIARHLELKARHLFLGAAKVAPLDLDDPKIAAGRNDPEKLVLGVATLMGLPRSILNFLDNEEHRRVRTRDEAGVQPAHTPDQVGTPPKP